MAFVLIPFSSFRHRLTELIAQVGTEQLIFGLDFPYNLEEHTQTALRVLSELDLDPQQLDRVWRGNLCEVLGMT